MSAKRKRLGNRTSERARRQNWCGGVERRIIGHIDLDAFFASVEERDRPYLRGQPIVIGADPQGGAGRGVVSTASYAARRYGIGSAMPISKAWQLCEAARVRGEPGCVFITGGFTKYGRASREVFAVLERYVAIIEKVSVDEAYFDLSFAGSFKKARASAAMIQRAIKRKTKLTCSIGIGPNKLIAKIASDHDKPRGLTVVLPSEVEHFLDPLPLRAVPGIGPKAAARFLRGGCRTVAEAKKLSPEAFAQVMGLALPPEKALPKKGVRRGESQMSLFSSTADTRAVAAHRSATHMPRGYARLRGVDTRPVEPEQVPRKSIGKHHTFMEDTHDMDAVCGVLREQARNIFRQLIEQGFSAFRTVVLTVRFDTFETKTRSVTATEPARSEAVLETRAIKLVLPFLDKTENPRGQAIRLIGLRVEKLS